MKASILFVLPLVLSASSFGAEKIQFSAKELAATFTLVRPELNTVVVQGAHGKFTPAPALRAMGVEAKEFDLNLSDLAAVAKLEFNDLRTGTPQIRFATDALELELPFVDNSAALKSALGNISIQGASMIVVLRWKSNLAGQEMLSADRAYFRGTMKGTGLAGSKLVIDGIKSFAERSFLDAMTKMLDQPEMQDHLRTALLGWAKFYIGEEQATILPATLQFYSTGTESGLAYQTEK